METIPPDPFYGLDDSVDRLALEILNLIDSKIPGVNPCKVFDKAIRIVKGRSTQP